MIDNSFAHTKASVGDQYEEKIDGFPYVSSLNLNSESFYCPLYQQLVHAPPFASALITSGAEYTDQSEGNGTFTGDFLDLASHRLPSKSTNFLYSQRISELRLIAIDEEIPVNCHSVSDFWQFVNFDHVMREGDILLLDNGNLRLVWNDKQGSHLGLQFLGDQLVQYVIFKRRNPSNPVSRVTGRDTFEGVKKQIRSFNLHSLIYA